MRPRITESAATPWLVLVGIAFIAGCALRSYALGEQIIVDDEWHVLHKAMRSPMYDIVSQLDYADFSIPVAIYVRWLSDHVGITELGLRLPMVMAGCLLVAAAPALAPAATRWPVRATWALLIALSPILIFASRIVRPYSLTILFCTIAVFAFPRWLDGRGARRSWAQAYVFVTVMSAWLHLVSLAFTLMPFAYFGVRAIIVRDRATFVRLVRLGVVTVIPLAVVLGPPLVRDWSRFAAKAGVADVTLEGAYRTLLMLSGSSHFPVLAAFVISGIAGGTSMWRADRALTTYLLSVVAFGTLAIVAVRPNWIQEPLVLARYTAPALPILLLFAAQGLVTGADLLARWLRWPAIAAAGVLLVLVGPLPRQYGQPNNFAHHQRFHLDYDDEHNTYVQRQPSDPVPAFYYELSRAEPGSLTLIEMPWRPESPFNPHVFYQAVHRQNVRIGLVTPICGTWSFGEYSEGESGMHLQNMAHLSAILRGETYGADFLVVHRKAWRIAQDYDFAWPDIDRCLPRMEAVLKAPVYRDDQIVVFNLRP